MTKKRSSEIFAVKMEIFSEKNVILVGEKFFRLPQTRRQVFATGQMYSVPMKTVEMVILLMLMHHDDVDDDA